MASGVFGLKKVYKRQVENINNGNFVSWTEDFTQGYIIAGKNPGGTNKSSTIRYDYDVDAIITLPSASNLPASNGVTNADTVSSYNYGYYGGGANPESNTIARLDFATELQSLPGTNLPTLVRDQGSISRSDEGYGYFIGGQNPAIASPKTLSTITRLDFTTETLSPMPNLPTPTATQFLRGFNGTTYGYALGGALDPGTAINTVHRLDFSNNTLAISLPGKNLTTARRGFVANETLLYGYACAGNPTLSTIERLDFNTENIKTLSAVTSNSSVDGTGFSSLLTGYLMAINGTNTIDELDFSNETIRVGGNFSDNNLYRQTAVSVSARHKQYNRNSGTAAYVNQGPSNNSVDKFFYQTETWSTSIFNASEKQGKTGGASSNTYGYIFGGDKGTGQTSLISRIDFSNDTNTSVKKGGDVLVLPSSVTSLADAGVTQSNSYAYYIAGSNGGSSSIFRMDFFTETFDLRGSLPAQRNNFASVKSVNAGYLIGNAVSTVFRLNFSNETLSTSLVYPISLNNSPHGYAYNERYGYFLGGQVPTASPTTVSFVYRLDFSNDTFSLLSQNTPAAGDKRGGCSSGDHAAYLNCLQDNGSSTVHRLSFSTETLTQLSPSPASRQDCVALTNANT